MTSSDKRLLLIQMYGALQPPDAEPFAVSVLAETVKASTPDWTVEAVTVDKRSGEEPSAKVLKLVETFRPRVVGLSVPQGTYWETIRLLERVTPISNPTPPHITVVGHAIPTYAPEKFLERFPRLIAVRGWGEIPLVALLKEAERNDRNELQGLELIPSIAYVRHGKIYATALAMPSVPPGVKSRVSGRFLRRMETSRGCQYGKCTFCTRPPGRADYWKRLPLTALRESLVSLREIDVRFFTFADEDFIGDDPDGAEQIAELLGEMGGFKFSISIRSDNVWATRYSGSENARRRSLLRKLQDVGLSFVFIGLESLCDSQLRRFGKGVTATEAVKALRVLNELKITTEVGFILFDPYVTVAELSQTAMALRESGIWALVSNLFPKMRVQRSSAMEARMKATTLLGEFDVETLSYGWDFQSAEVKRVWEAADSWSTSFEPSLRLIRNRHRQMSDHDVIREALDSIRHLDVEVLEFLILNASHLEKADGSLEPFEKRRSSIWQTILPALASEYEVTEEVLQDWISQELS